MTAPSVRSTASAAGTILRAGALAGVLDITAACVFAGLRGAPPIRVFQGIAGGLLGPTTFEGGAATAALGLFLHFCIATGAAAVFYAVSRRAPVLVSRPVASGVAYGVVVWAVMRFVVLPLSAARPGPLAIAVVIPMILIHMVCVGLPIALVVRRDAT